MSALNFRCSIRSEQLSATRIADRLGRPRPHLRHGAEPRGAHRAPRLLAARAPTRRCSRPRSALVGAGPVGVFAAASAEPRRTAAEHIALLAGHGVHGGRPRRHHRHRRLRRRTTTTSSTSIAGLRGILLCGGNQIRLVETLLHRGEESAVLRAIARAHARGAVLIAASGAASALSGVMIAGGSSYEALRYGVSSDTGHRGLVIQEGIGLFAGGIVDQNLIGGNRLGRLIVACAEESERFGVGVFEDSAVIASHAGTRLEATGLQRLRPGRDRPDRRSCCRTTASSPAASASPCSRPATPPT